MKTKFTRDELLMVIFAIIFIWNIGLLRILPFDIFLSVYPGRYFSALLIIMSFFIWLPKGVYRTNYCFWMIFGIYFFLSLELIASIIRYNQSILRLSTQNVHWLFLALVYFILIVSEKIDIKKLYKFIVMTTLMTLFIRTLCWGFYNLKGIVLFPNVLGEFGTLWTRNGLVRFSSTATGSLSFILLFYHLFTCQGKKKQTQKFICALLLICIFLYDYFIYQSRAECIICIVTAVSMYLTLKRHTINSYTRKIIIIFFAIMILAQTGLIQTVIGSFDVNAESGGTTRSRIYALDYFYNMYRSNPILGFGMLDTSNDYTLKLWTGPDGNRYLDDLGVIGMFMQYGMVGAGIFLAVFLRMFYLWILAKNENRKFLLGGLLVLFCLMSILSSSPFDPQRIIVLPLMFGLFEFSNHDKKNKLNHKKFCEDVEFGYKYMKKRTHI